MKLFNKLRLQMIEGKRLKNYLLYGLGEIILVVIGIMIALNINNWQQEKANQNELNRIINVVEADLKSDLVQAERIIKFSKPSEKLIVKMLYDPKFQDSIRNCNACRYIMAQTQITDFNYKGYELLANYNKDLQLKNSAVDSIMNFYERYSRAEFAIKNKIILDEVVDNMKYLRDNFDWYSAYYIADKCNDDCLDYFESPNYINRLTYFEALFYDDFLYIIELYKQDLENTIAFLNNHKTE